MSETKECPFCGKPITAIEYAALRDKIRKAEDPAILREFEVVREEITKSLRDNMEAEYAPVRRQLDAYIKREKDLNERSTELELRSKAIEAEVAKRVSASQVQLVAKAESRVREELQLAANEKDTEIKNLTDRITKFEQGVESRVSAGIEDREKKLRDEMQLDFNKRYAGTLAKLKEYQGKELSLERARQDLAVKEQGLELEVQKRLSGERESLFRTASQQAREAYEMDAREKEKNIQSLKQQVAQLCNAPR